MADAIDADLVVDGFLTAYRGNTLRGYMADVRRFRSWLDELELQLLEAKRAHVQLYRQHLEDQGLAPATVARHLTCLRSLYRYAEEEEFVTRSPARHVKMPWVSDESTSPYLDRQEMGRYITFAEADGVMSHALVCLLMVDGLRVSEAIGTTIADLGFNKGHRTVAVIRKGNRPGIVPLPPRALRAVLFAVGERTVGPILLNRYGNPMTRHNASRITHRVARNAGIDKSIGPHALRHSFATAGLEAHVPLRKMQASMGHADPKSTIRYDRSRFSLDDHAAYMVAAFIAGGT